ncbi:MAG: T9SS type A sorting domain-containing protein [Ignavibacteria bacterium]|nr:T9SS type A sorting domain-containing protein [Ignavibacteria bacterium]
MKNYLKVVFSLFLITSTYSQWIEYPLPETVDVWGLANKDSVVFAGTEIGFQQPGYVFRSMDFGVSWDTLTGLPFAGGWSFAFIDSILVAGSFGWGIYLSSDLGNSWVAPDSGIAPDENVHVVLKHKSYVYAATADSGNGILRSSDNGNSWIEVNTGLPQFSSFLSLASNGEDIYTTSIEGVFRSTDDGMNWFSISNGLPGNAILSLAAQGSKVYAGTAVYGIFFSSNYGENWINISGSVPNVEIWTLVLVDTNLFVATIGSGIYLTQNDGISWTWVSEGLPNLNIRTLLVTNNNYLFAGTTNGFVCKRPLSEMITSVTDKIYLLSDYSLSQNYPNPFNPSTKISWQSPVSSWQTLKIYDVLGNEVATLVDEYKPAGNYKVEWDASNYSSGVYFYQLIAGDFVETKKMVLMK